MQCPVCGSEDCVRPAPELAAALPSRFRPCPECRMQVRDKHRPPVPRAIGGVCTCGKRFIDEVFAHLWMIMAEEEDLAESDPLIATGSPLIHPGFVMDQPPFLPERSLILLSSRVTGRAAERIVAEVPEVKGVVRAGTGVPGISSPDLDGPPQVHELLAGCDVRADIVPVAGCPVAIYKQQSLIHIEFPRPGYPKIRSVEQQVGSPPVRYFIDACSGAGTLGIAAARLGVARVVMNDAWYASAFWSAFNLDVNRDLLRIGEVRFHRQLPEMVKDPVRRLPELIAETEGPQVIRVYQGDLHELPVVLGRDKMDTPPLTVFDLFCKSDPAAITRIEKDWNDRVGGRVFIP